jgi:hypothetical protein
VYGDEPVVFEIAGAPSAAVEPAPLELVDERGHTLAKATLSVPGQWRPPGVPSGDFTLSVGLDRTRCTVTVNRELSRATQP